MKIDGALFGNFTEAGEAAARLEADGYGAAWSFEGPHDPFFPLVLASRTTERIELGTAIAIAFARNPMNLANLAHGLQAITGGRSSASSSGCCATSASPSWPASRVTPSVAGSG